MRVSGQRDCPWAFGACEAFLATEGNLPEGFDVYVALAKDAAALSSLPSQTKTMVLPDEFNYLADGDVLRLWPKSNGVRVLYRRNSFHNHFLLTERCNHYCLMCSQPPKTSTTIGLSMMCWRSRSSILRRLALLVENRLFWETTFFRILRQ